MSLKEYINKLYWDEGLTQEEIGKIYGKSGAWVCLQMKKFNIPSKDTVDIKTRFLSYIKIPQNPNDCWEWKGCKNHQGYGEFGFNGKIMRANRVSYILFKGEFNSTLCCLHSCDNPGCVNPEHLFLGNKKDNANDRMRKGRNGDVKGIKNGRAKLTENDVKEIRYLLSIGLSGAKIARMFKVHKGQIYNIKYNRNWNHVTI